MKHGLELRGREAAAAAAAAAAAVAAAAAAAAAAATYRGYDEPLRQSASDDRQMLM
jgi:ribosomal protein L12E/L44/L45/RPP1/RPP2